MTLTIRKVGICHEYDYAGTGPTYPPARTGAAQLIATDVEETKKGLD
jgi:hypothetical protein